MDKCMICFMLFSSGFYQIFALRGNCEITKLKAHCKHKQLYDIPTHLPPTIDYLDLSDNHITTLRSKSFRRYKNLNTLIINGNQLSRLEASAFWGLEKLQNLSMRNNQLDLNTSYPLGIFRQLRSLEKLDLRNNFVDGRSVEPVYYPQFGHLRSLKNLSIDLALNPVFNNSGLRLLSQLQILRFEKCYLNSMPNTTFLGFPKTVREIYFRHCEPYIEYVDKNVLNHFPGLKVLSMQKANIDFTNALQLLYPFRNTNMTVIQFVRTVKFTQQAIILTRKMMSYLQTICVSTLVLAENEIVDFEKGSLLAHKYPQCFENFIITGNRFPLALKHLREFFLMSTQAVNLKIFDFSYNPLKYINIKYLQIPGLDTLSSEDSDDDHSSSNYHNKGGIHILSRKQINSVVHETILLPKSLQTLRMSYFLSEWFPKNALVIKNASSLQHLDVSYFQISSIPNINFDGPVNIRYLDISGINSTLYCKQSHIPLLKNISTIIMKDARLAESMRQSCSIFTLIPGVKTLVISWNNLYFIDTTAFSTNNKLSKLVVSFNLLPEIPLAITRVSFLRELDIQYNILHTINQTVRDWIDQQNQRLNGKFKLYLWGNVFKCTCDTVDFITWLFQTKVKLDKKYRNYRCTLGNGTEANIDDVYRNLNAHFSGCNSKLWLRIGIGFLTGFCVLTFPLALLVNYRWKIAFWIYRKFRRVIEHKIEKKFTYDVYLSYPKSCCGWIKNILIPKIEDSWKLKMCFEERDFLPGEIHADAIVYSIQESRHVIFVISDTPEENLWREYEIERTKFEKCTSDLQKIIVITKQASFSDIPYQLDKILSDVTMIEWTDDDEMVWDKLHMTIFSVSI